MIFFVRLLPNVENYDEAKKRSGEWIKARGLRLNHEMRVATLRESAAKKLRPHFSLTVGQKMMLQLLEGWSIF